jgi:Aminotransferase class-V
MKPFLDNHYGNPSSGHWAAAAAKAALETARDQVAALLGCRSDEIIFTSGGSEANNLALKGVRFATRATTSSPRRSSTRRSSNLVGFSKVWVRALATYPSTVSAGLTLTTLAQRSPPNDSHQHYACQ